MIKFKTINCDDLEIDGTFENLESLQNAWNSEECDVPSLDDVLIYSEIDEKGIDGDTFKDFMNYLKDNYGFIM